MASKTEGVKKEYLAREAKFQIGVLNGLENKLKAGKINKKEAENVIHILAGKIKNMKNLFSSSGLSGRVHLMFM